MEGVWQQGFDDDANVFFDLSDRYAHLDAKRDPLVEIATIVPWEEFRPTLAQDQLLAEVSARTRREDELLRKNAGAEILLREFRSVLITAAVTGQIDVATWGKQGQTDRRLDEIEEAMQA